ncbi:hypothetical protein E2320_013215, partial [Naja naja]
MSEISSDSDSSCGWTVINHEVDHGQTSGPGCLPCLAPGAGAPRRNGRGTSLARQGRKCWRSPGRAAAKGGDAGPP